MNERTSHRWPMIGASAQECSAFSPMVPFLKTIRLKDLSNHLWRKQPVSLFGTEEKLDPYASSAPPVVALSVKQRLGVTVQRRNGVVGIVALLRVVQGNEESRLFNGIQRLLVLTAAEVGVTSVGPRGPAGYQTTSVNGGRNDFTLV